MPVLPFVLSLLVAGAPVSGQELPRYGVVFSGHSTAERTDYDLYRVCADGSQLAALVVAPEHQFQASVSPDGTWMVYTTVTDTTEGRALVRRALPAGTDSTLAPHPADDTGPAIGPAGRRVAFASTRDAEKPEIYVLEVATGVVTRLTHDARHDSGVAWLPDGSGVLFTRYTPGVEGASGSGDVVRLDLATGEETVLTDLGGYSGGLDVRGDGGAVVFHRTAEGGSELWRMDADGRDARPLTDTFVDEYEPRYSPDGAWLLFTAGTEHDGRGTFDLYLMPSEGGEVRRLTDAAGTEGWARWRPGVYCR
ncbi:MAG: hypothetical protein R3181_00045 [Rubricoccaceae bacterium]|nr:hypothetical protein [Rubricoccaceae bacterium]